MQALTNNKNTVQGSRYLVNAEGPPVTNIER